MMSNIVILFADNNSSYMFESVFDGKSALDLSLRWARKQGSEKVVVFAFPENEEKLREAEKDFASNYVLLEDADDEGDVLGGDFSIDFVVRSDWTIHNLMSEIKKSCDKYNADYAVYAWADCPFLNMPLTNEVSDTHNEFAAEYTFAEGFPYGLSPEVIDAGTAGILATLSETTQKETGDRIVTRTSVFDLLKTDINSFEIETVLSDEDWRLFRFSFDTGTKSNYFACKSLYKIFVNEISAGRNLDISYMAAERLAEVAAVKKEIIKTIPSFYNIQISNRISGNPIYIPEGLSTCHQGDMCYSEQYDASHSERSRGISEIDFEKLCRLIDDIADFSENAVINLSYFGEPFANPNLLEIIEKILSYKGLSVFIETDGLFVTEEIAGKIKSISDNALPRANGYEKIMFAISLDALTGETFEKVRGIPKSEFPKAVNAVSIIAKYFPSAVYPQFIRMNENEAELEGFYRFWNEKSNPSNGNMIIQKYNSYCGILPERKPADLSPLERNVCWHLRRDVSILINGDVSFCHSNPTEKIGNVFEESLYDVWSRTDGEVQSQIEKFCKKNSDAKICEKCGKCDEYYTFNF